MPLLCPACSSAFSLLLLHRPGSPCRLCIHTGPQPILLCLMLIHMSGCTKPVWSIHCVRIVIIIGLNPQSACQFSEFSFENTKPFCLTHPACHTALGPFQQPGPVLITAAQHHAEQGILQVGLFPGANALCKKGLWGSHGLKHHLLLPKIPSSDSPSPIKRCLILFFYEVVPFTQLHN